MNDDRRDELHDKAISELYRQTRTAEPPSWLDQRVLKAAVEAPRPASRLKPRKSRWKVPLALAATVVLTAGVLRMADEAGEFRLDSASEPAPSKVESAAKAESAAIGNSRPSPTERARSALPEASSPAAVLSAEVPAPAPATVARDTIEKKTRSGSLARPASPAKPATSPPQAPAFEAKKEDRLQEAAPDAWPARQERSADRSPEQWLKDIADLRRQGRTAEADESLTEFRWRYPHYPLDAPESPR